MSAAFRNMDTSLEEAALTAGSSTFSTFCRVTLPLMRPAMFSVLLVIFIRGIEAFEVPALVGVPAKISVFTTKIFLAIHQFPSDFGLAGAYAVTLLLISTTGVLIYGRITRREDRYASVIAWITVKTKLPGRALLDNMTFIPIAMPGIVLGVSLIWVYLTLPIPIYGTIWVLLLAYITKFMPYGIRAASASMIQINKELE